MSSSALGAFIRLEESRTAADSQKAVPSNPKVPQALLRTGKSPTKDELDAMPLGRGAHYSGPAWDHREGSSSHSKPVPAITKVTKGGAGVTIEQSAATDNIIDGLDGREQMWTTSMPNGAQTPNDLEMSRPASPTVEPVTSVVQSWNNPRMNKWRILSACLSLFGNGMNDSAPGALLPTMERHYNIDYGTVSTIFVSNAVGFILAAFFVHTLDSRLGRARSLMLCDGVSIAGYIMMALAPPFPAFAVGFFITGWGIATSLALHNVFVANLANATILLGGFHGSYGIGGTVGPVIATALVTHGTLFSYFYFIPLGIRAVSFVFSGWAFFHFERDTLLAAGNATNSLVQLSPVTNETTSRSTRSAVASTHVTGPNTAPEVKRERSQLLTALKTRTTLVGAAFIFAYQGAEVAVSGWVISFLINYRNGAPSKVGYVTSGFWAGITLGRFLLTHIAARFGERSFVFMTIVGSAIFQILIWFVPNVIGDAISIALLGFLLGPIYPAATTVFTRTLPRKIQNTSLAFVSSAGSSGGALAPFATGLLAQAYGTWVLHPICVGLFIVMAGCWVGLPKVGKRRE